MQTLSMQIWKRRNDPLVLKVLSILWDDKAIESLGVYRVSGKEPRVNFAVNCSSATAVWRRIGKKLNKLPGFKDCAVISFLKDNDWNNAEVIQSAFNG